MFFMRDYDRIYCCKIVTFAGMKNRGMKNIIVCFVSLAAVLLAGCGGRTHSVAILGDAVYTPKYATRFSILGTEGESTVVEIRNPWQGAESVSMQLFVARNGEAAPEGFDGVTVNAPLERVVCFSSTHVAFIDALTETDKIKGVSGADYISNQMVRDGYVEGNVRDVGYDPNINYELLASLRPDLVMIYGVAGENTAVSNKLRELHIPFVYIGEYLETDPLGKAEWVVAFGELFDKRDKAGEIFDNIADNYNAVKKEAALFTDHPKVMLNAPYRDVWFVPGDRSYMVRLINDAGGEYIFAGEDSDVSRPISGEAAYMSLQQADVWLNPNQALNIAELKSQNPKFADVKCVKDKTVYNCTKRRTSSGGSDFWESGVLRADIVLKDIVKCLHPEWEESVVIGTDGVESEKMPYETYYFHVLE